MEIGFWFHVPEDQVYIHHSKRFLQNPDKANLVIWAKKWIRTAHTSENRKMFVGPNKVWLREECSLSVPSAVPHFSAPLLLGRACNQSWPMKCGTCHFQDKAVKSPCTNPCLFWCQDNQGDDAVHVASTRRYSSISLGDGMEQAFVQTNMKEK